MCVDQASIIVYENRNKLYIIRDRYIDTYYIALYYIT